MIVPLYEWCREASFPAPAGHENNRMTQAKALRTRNEKKMAKMPPTIKNAPMIKGRASAAPKTFANKKMAMMIVNTPKIPGPQPAPVKALISPTIPMIKASTAKKMIKKVPTKTVAYTG